MSITYDTYGKIKVRLVKVTRHSKENHDLKQLNVAVLLEGDFEKSFTSDDNSQVVPTDTCKNMVYVVARDHPIKSIEEYGQALAAKFLSEYSHVKKVNVEITEDIWERMPVNGKPHGHSFVKAMYVRTAKISAPRGAPAVVESGVRDLQVLKTTGSGFENFHRCRYTTLPDVADRLFGTKVQAVWTYTPEAVRGGYKSVDFNDTWNKVLALVFSTFATEYSPSVQRTIHSAGEKVVTRLTQVENITLSMPNIHNWTIDFNKLKLENTPDLLIPVDEPSGFIHATITKPKSKM